MRRKVFFVILVLILLVSFSCKRSRNNISSSDIQDKIEADLNGIEFRFESRGIVSHPDFCKWVEMRLSPFLED